jgi:hypothetical protein
MSLKLIIRFTPPPPSFLQNLPDANRIQEAQKQKVYLLKLHNEVLANIRNGQNKILVNVCNGHIRPASVINYIFLMQRPSSANLHGVRQIQIYFFIGSSWSLKKNSARHIHSASASFVPFFFMHNHFQKSKQRANSLDDDIFGFIGILSSFTMRFVGLLFQRKG